MTGGCYEHCGPRHHFWLGNIARWSEEEQGIRMGGQVSFSIDFGDHVGNFDSDGREYDRDLRKMVTVDTPRHYLTYGVHFMVWRWGISLDIRGKEIDPSTWDIPQWKLDSHGELLEEWR